MKVYILFKDCYEGRAIEGVYETLEAAQAKCPDVQWEQDEDRYRYAEDDPPLWADGRKGWDHADAHIEEHEVNQWAASGNAETYEQWIERQPESIKEEARQRGLIGELK